jgi:hypothetical protein
MAKIQAEGIVEYARIFADNYDDNMDFHENTKGQYNMNFYPDNVEEFINQGFPETKGPWKTIKDGNPSYGSGKYVKLKRPVFNPNLPNDDGTKGVEMGPPKVLNRTSDPKGSAEWSFTNDGAIGNGSRVKVLVNIYEGRAVIDTLEKVAILEHEPYEAGATGDDF